MRLGLGFSGGGSRAAGFHRGTLRALFKLGLVSDEIIKNKKIAVSTVSGGSVFGAAWLASRADGMSTDDFLEEMKAQLNIGFIARSMRPRLLGALLPGYTRTHAVAKTFDKAIFHEKKLADLPKEPPISINTSVLNNGQVGKFSQTGFRCTGLVPYVDKEFPGRFPLYKAVGASAAFPIGLPPIYLKVGKDLPADAIKNDEYVKHKKIALSDGGVLENLGVQTLLKSRPPLKSWDIIASDAGAPLKPWKPGILNKVKGIGMGFLSASVLSQVATLMNDKENRHMRYGLYEELTKTWLAEGHHDPVAAKEPGFKAHLSDKGKLPNLPRRKLIILSIDQDWKEAVNDLPEWRLVELETLYEKKAGKKPPQRPEKPNWTAPDEEKQAYADDLVHNILAIILEDSRRTILEEAEHTYEDMGGDEAVAAIKKISTGFTALSEEKLELLHEHSYWQTHLSYALYW